MFCAMDRDPEFQQFSSLLGINNVCLCQQRYSKQKDGNFAEKAWARLFRLAVSVNINTIHIQNNNKKKLETVNLCFLVLPAASAPL